MLVTAAINLGVMTILFFILGMLKPQWPLFFMEKPNRFIILMVTTVLIMVSFTMYGEGIRRGSTINQWVSPTAKAPAPTTAPASVPVPQVTSDVPAPATPATTPTTTSVVTPAPSAPTAATSTVVPAPAASSTVTPAPAAPASAVAAPKPVTATEPPAKK